MQSYSYKSAILLILAASSICGCSQESTPGNAMSAERPILMPTARPQPTVTPVLNAPRQLTIFLPGQDGKLHETRLKEQSDLAQKRTGEPESALAMLFRKAPEIIPADTKLTDEIRKNKDYRNPDEPDIDVVFEVRLNKEFSNSLLWHDKKKARLAFEAIVKTAARSISDSIHPTYPFHIYVLVNDKPVTKLGNFKVKNPAYAW